MSSGVPPPDWAAIYAKHKDKMWGVARRVLREAGGESETADVVQEAMRSSNPSMTRLGGPARGPPGRLVLSPFRSAGQVGRNVLSGLQPRFATGPGEVLVRRLQDRRDPRVVSGDTVHQAHPSSTAGPQSISQLLVQVDFNGQ